MFSGIMSSSLVLLSTIKGVRENWTFFGIGDQDSGD